MARDGGRRKSATAFDPEAGGKHNIARARLMLAREKSSPELTKQEAIVHVIGVTNCHAPI